MNIFVLHTNPDKAATYQCDKHVPKMCVETAQMMATAVRNHGARDCDMPLTQANKPYKGGYPHHPCTLWASECQENFLWLAEHGLALCIEFESRFEKEHACFEPILEMLGMHYLLPENGEMTPFALAMPDEYRPIFHMNNHGIATYINNDGKYIVTHASGQEAVEAYRDYYHSKEFAEWNYTDQPEWWTV